MQLFELTINEEEKDGVFAVSLVDEPAIEVDWVAFSNKKKIQFLDEEKQIITGPVLIPDIKIFRIDGNGNEYYVYADSETISKAQQLFAKNKYTDKITLMHSKDITGSGYIFESWIKQSENDKSNDMGIDVPIGTWLVSMKIEDEKIWELIKKGEIKGFSIEAYFNHIKIENNKNNKIMDKFLTKLSSLLKEFSEEPEKEKEKDEFEYVEVEDGSKAFINEEGFMFTVGENDEVLEPYISGEYQLSDGRIITVGEEGEILSIMMPDEETEENVEEPSEEPDEESYTLENGINVDVIEDVAYVIDEKTQERVFAPEGNHTLENGDMLIIGEEGEFIEIVTGVAMSIINKLMSEKEEKESKFKKLKNELKDLKKEYEELANSPADTKFNSENSLNDEIPTYKKVAKAISHFKNK